LELRRQAGTISEAEYAQERAQAEKVLREAWCEADVSTRCADLALEGARWTPPEARRIGLSL